MNFFAERFLELRKKSNASYSLLAKKLEISLRALKYYGSGEREPTMSTLITLADYFNVSIDYLVGRSDDPTRH